jgi:hypothetical protein
MNDLFSNNQLNKTTSRVHSIISKQKTKKNKKMAAEDLNYLNKLTQFQSSLAESIDRQATTIKTYLDQVSTEERKQRGPEIPIGSTVELLEALRKKCKRYWRTMESD